MILHFPFEITNFYQVQQRGIKGTQQILRALLDGIVEDSNTPILVVDMLPNRPWFYYVHLTC